MSSTLTAAGRDIPIIIIDPSGDEDLDIEIEKPKLSQVKQVGRQVIQADKDIRRHWWCPMLYIVIVPAYTALGGLAFWLLERQHSAGVALTFKKNCSVYKSNYWPANDYKVDVDENCWADADCRGAVERRLSQLIYCVHQFAGQPGNLSNYVDSVALAATVYTTLGYGNWVVKTPAGYVFTIVYACVGVPLFFAFIADFGYMLSIALLTLPSFCRQLCLGLKRRWTADEHWHTDQLARTQSSFVINFGDAEPSKSMMELLELPDSVYNSGLTIATLWHEKFRSLFLLAFILAYTFTATLIMYLAERPRWSYVQSYYFLLQSMALIGFGDIVPRSGEEFLFLHYPLIMVGMIMIMVAYFVITEHIRFITLRIMKKLRKYSASTNCEKTNLVQPANCTPPAQDLRDEQAKA